MLSNIQTIAFLAVFSIVNISCSRDVSFNNDVQPILKANCMQCHDGTKVGEGTKKTGFSVKDYQSIMKGTDLGPVVVPGDSASSTLFRLISHQTDPKIQMPPHHDLSLAEGRGKPLTDAEIETIKLWINQGAKDN